MHSTLREWQTANKRQLQSPKIAWPTFFLFLMAFIFFITSTGLAMHHTIPVFIAFIINAMMQFIMFTVLHDASHRSFSQMNWLNESVGTVALFLLTPLASIKVFRFIHMQHHRFTNESIEKDPDYWAAKGPKWLLPVRWMFLDFHYLYWYLGHWNNRPRKERFELIGTLFAAVMLLTVLGINGYGYWAIVLWLLSGRLGSSILVMAFDFLPHYPHDVTAKDNEFRATNLKPTLSWLMTPVLLSQNYHLIHHLYPRIPFYKYAWVWRSARDPLLLSGTRLMRWNGQELDSVTYQNNSPDESVKSPS